MASALSSMVDGKTSVAAVQTQLRMMQYNANVDRTIPFVTLTFAQSIDGSIALRRGEPLLLSGAESMKMSHELRALHDGILVGIGTVIADNPSLTTRLVKGSNPRTVILDSQLRTPLEKRKKTKELRQVYPNHQTDLESWRKGLTR